MKIALISLFALLLSAVLLVGCTDEHGSLNNECRPDGSCNPNLQCDGSHCRLAAKRRCSYESECYCVTCAEQCGARGMKACRFSDTTVWGNHTPATCECNEEKTP